MMIEFKLPNLGEGVDSADIAEILIAEGDEIEGEQIVMELETDKAVVELPCPHAGTIQKLAVGEGDTVSVGQVLFSIDAAETADGADDAGVVEDNALSDGDSSVDAAQSADDATEAADDATAEADDRPVESRGKETPETDEPPGDDQPASGSVEFTLPNIGEGVETADIAEIHVAAGDVIEADQIVMDLETDKAVVELPCQHAGTVSAVHVSAGDTVSVGQKLLTLDSVASPSDRGSKPQKTEADKKPATSTPPRERKESASPSNGQPSAVATARSPEIVRDDNGPTPVPAAPSTRRLARQLGVNLRQVGGSGPGGRITQEDVQAFVKSRLTSGLPAVSGGGGGMMVAAGGALAPPPLPDFSKFGVIEREKLNKLSRTAAENLTVSWNVIPHVTQHDRADVTDLESARKKFTKGAGAQGPKVTMTAIVIKALATALQQNPKFNSSLDPETMEIVLKRYYHIGCAVDTENGLLVPVVKDVDQKSIREVAGEINELAALARDRKLPIDAMQGATCTVTNLGGIGGVAFTPIVNYPEVCILGLARGQQELRLENGELTERLMLPLSLSYDHRVINGADAARFLVSLCQMLSDPFQLLSAI